MDTLISKMNDSARKTWDKIRKSHCMENTDEEYTEWRDETISYLKEGGDEMIFDICSMDGVDVNEMEDVLFHAFE